MSNGYLVIGGGDSGDIVFTPQHFPNAARPNNVLAPIWSDLNPPAAPAGGGFASGPLTAGDVNTWMVVDWPELKNFGNATTHSFQIWLRLATGAAGAGPFGEVSRWPYGRALTPARSRLRRGSRTRATELGC